jgi:deoxyribonuclease V
MKGAFWFLENGRMSPFLPPTIAAGSIAPLIDHGETIGVVLRTRGGINPVYVSVGHRVTLDGAIAVVLSCVTRYRLPEPTRLAHILVTGRRRDE